MSELGMLEERITRILRDEMAIDVPSPATDLVDAGYIDSLLLAELLSRLEAELDVRVRIEELDMDQLRTIAGLARFAAAHGGGVDP
jgi:acyl carrier protein